MYYLLVGAVVGFLLEYIMNETDMNDDTTLGERVVWVIGWPIFVLAFLWGMFKDD
jgi:hypothetical protein